MEKSRQIWEQIPVSSHNITEKYRSFYRNLLSAGYVNIEDLDNNNPTVIINPNANNELLGKVREFCESHTDLLGQIATDIPIDDKQRFVVEMAHRLKIIALHDDSDFGKIVATLRDMVTKGSVTILRNSALSYIAFYYYEHIQQTMQDNVVSMEEFRDRVKAVG